MTLEKKDITASLVKELTGDMKKDELLPGEDMMGLASVEIFDSDGDIIRVDGINTDSYHQPPNRYIKLLASHYGSLSNGEPSIIGRIERFWKTKVQVKGQLVPALAFAFSFAKDESGNLTPLANAYKRLMPKYLDSFSVGIMVNKSKTMDNGRFDVIQSSLYEISAVTIPANAEANVIKHIKKELASAGVVEEEAVPVGKPQDSVNTNTHIIVEIKSFLETLSSKIVTLEENLEKRLDGFESTLASLSKDVMDEKTNSTKTHPKETDLKALTEIKKALDKIKGFSSK